MPFTFPGPHTAAVGTRPRPLVGARPGQTGAMAAWMPQVPRRAPAPTSVPPALRPPSVMPVAPMAAQPAPYAGPSPWPAIPFNPYDPALPWPAPAMPLDPYRAPIASDVPGPPGPADVVLVDDRRTDASMMTSDADAVPLDAAAGDEWATPTLVDAVTAPALIAAPPDVGVTALDLWDHLFSSHLAVRNAAASATGEAYPETNVGDVRRAALALSRALCLPRYDGADLRATRAAWRDACVRVEAVASGRPWAAPYPENERFWLSDALALAQRLADVDRRRNRQRDGLDLDAFLGDRSDALTTWQDLRAYFLGRRLVRHDGRGGRYPETTVGDVTQIVQVFEADAARVLAELTGRPAARRTIAGHVAAWQVVARAVAAHAAHLSPTAIYPDNAAFWQASKKLALWLSTGADVTRDGALGGG